MPLNAQAILRQANEGQLIAVRITPKSTRNMIDGIYRDSAGAMSLQIHVTAQPEKDKANKALIQTLSKALKLPKSRLSIASGETSRHKAVLVRAEKADILKALSALQIDD